VAWRSPLPPALRIEPFAIRVQDAVLADLRARIRQTRWPNQAPGVAWAQGTDLPQTVGYGLNDSPAGLAAWILEIELIEMAGVFCTARDYSSLTHAN
jgi:hypothetical protein